MGEVLQIRPGQLIVSKDRKEVLAEFQISMDLNGNAFNWATIASIFSPIRFSNPPSLDRVVHTVVVDYMTQNGEVIIWRYVGNSPSVAFEESKYFASRKGGGQ